MKPHAILTSLAGLALVSATEPAEVFDISRPSHSKQDVTASPPHLPRQLARHILLQRTGDDHSSFFDDLPEHLDRERALLYLNEFGREPAGLFSSEAGARRPSLVVMLEGVTTGNVRDLKEELASRGQTVSFTITDPPSAEANRKLAEQTFGSHSGASTGSLEALSGFARVDLSKQPEAPLFLISRLGHLSARMDTMIVLMPESSRASGPKEWTSSAQLYRRSSQLEESVITDESAAAQNPKKQQQHQQQQQQQTGPSKRIPACFPSEGACANATNGCSGHGECVNRYAKLSDAGTVCFHCLCSVTKYDDRAPDVWAGKTCSKKDISPQFWLIAGLTVALVGMVSFSIGLLFSVGEEKLPGVIGAGVSRTSK